MTPTGLPPPTTGKESIPLRRSKVRTADFQVKAEMACSLYGHTFHKGQCQVCLAGEGDLVAETVLGIA